jgi:uncharacterized membrane protein
VHICRGVLGMKTASYAIMHFAVAILVAFALTLDWRKALAIGIVEPFVQTFAFALHERWWSRRAGGGASGAKASFLSKTQPG